MTNSMVEMRPSFSVDVDVPMLTIFGNGGRQRRQHAALVGDLHAHEGEKFALDVIRPLHRQLAVFLAALGDVRASVAGG